MLPLLELIEDEYSDHEDLVRMAAFTRATHERLVQIINEVKAFVRFEREQVATQNLALAEVVHELVEFLRFERSLPPGTLTVEIQAEPLVKAHRVKLQQVVLNLLKNAGHAVRDVEAAAIKLSLTETADTAVITVADNGCGMTPEVAQRIWEPFFTTKGEEGTGLGLDVAKSIVEAHGGTIECETAPQRGARFTIRLPKCAPLAGITEAAAGRPALVSSAPPLTLEHALPVL
jgi:C4-dicarboxylate-specific signal transduction histidine kinase